MPAQRCECARSCSPARVQEWNELSKMDQLGVFEGYIRDCEREKMEQLRKERNDDRRKQRKIRDAFKELLDRGEEEYWVHARALWHTAFPKVPCMPPCTHVTGRRGSRESHV